MSGGAFNYLCHALDLQDFAARRQDLDEMARDLASLGYAADAAEETAAVLAQVRAADTFVSASARRLYDVWKALEWWRSGDRGEEAVHDALTTYRGGTPAARTYYPLTPEEAAAIEAMRRNEETDG